MAFENWRGRRRNVAPGDASIPAAGLPRPRQMAQRHHRAQLSMGNDPGCSAALLSGRLAHGEHSHATRDPHPARGYFPCAHRRRPLRAVAALSIFRNAGLRSSCARRPTPTLPAIRRDGIEAEATPGTPTVMRLHGLQPLRRPSGSSTSSEFVAASTWGRSASGVPGRSEMPLASPDGKVHPPLSWLSTLSRSAR